MDDTNISIKPHEGEALCENVYASIPRERKQTKVLHTSFRHRKSSISSLSSQSNIRTKEPPKNDKTVPNLTIKKLSRSYTGYLNRSSHISSKSLGYDTFNEFKKDVLEEGEKKKKILKDWRNKIN